MVCAQVERLKTALGGCPWTANSLVISTWDSQGCHADAKTLPCALATRIKLSDFVRYIVAFASALSFL